MKLDRLLAVHSCLCPAYEMWGVVNTVLLPVGGRASAQHRHSAGFSKQHSHHISSVTCLQCTLLDTSLLVQDT